MSVCPNCGSEVESGFPYCDVCGSMMPEEPLPSTSKRKKSKVPIVIGVIVVAAIGAGGAAFAAVKTGIYQRTCYSPKKYLVYSEKKSAGELFNIIANTSEENSAVFSGGNYNSIALSLGLGDTAKTLLSMYDSELDLSWLDNISLTSNTSSSDTTVDVSLSLGINGNNLVTANTSTDFLNNMYYLQLPALSDALLEMDISELLEEIPLDLESYMTFEPIDVTDTTSVSTLDPSSIEEFFTKYTDLILNKLNDVEKSKSSLEEGSITENVTALTVTLNADTLATIINETAVNLKDDDNADSIIRSLADYAAMGNDYYNDAEGFIDDYEMIIDEIVSNPLSAAELGMDGDIIGTFYINNDDQIIGFNLNYAGIDLAEVYSIDNANDSATNFYYYDGENSYSLTWEGNNQKNIVTGSYNFCINDLEIMTIDVEDYDINKVEEGYLNGTITLSPSSLLLNELPDDYSSLAVLSPSLRITFTSDSGNSDMECALEISGAEILTLGITAFSSDLPPVSVIPTESDQVYNIDNPNDLLAYMKGFNWDALESIIDNSGLPDVYNSLLNMYINTLKLSF